MGDLDQTITKTTNCQGSASHNFFVFVWVTGPRSGGYLLYLGYLFGRQTMPSRRRCEAPGLPPRVGLRKRGICSKTINLTYKQCESPGAEVATQSDKPGAPKVGSLEVSSHHSANSAYTLCASSSSATIAVSRSPSCNRSKLDPPETSYEI